MADYAVTDWTAQYDSMTDAVAGLETKLETIANTKTIRAIGIVRQGALFHAYLIYDA